MKHTTDQSPYLIGLGWDLRDLRRYAAERDWRALRYRIRSMTKYARRRSWWGIWQMEWPGCGRAVRGVTYERCYRRGIREWTRQYEAQERARPASRDSQGTEGDPS